MPAPPLTRPRAVAAAAPSRPEGGLARCGRLVRATAARRLVAILKQVRLVRSAHGPVARVRLAGIVLRSLRTATAAQPASSAVPVAYGPSRSWVWLRPRSTDLKALRFPVDRTDHLPPADLTGPVATIAVLGANIGLLVADLADRYPAARLLGVEADPDNAELARRNVGRFAGRCRIHQALVWHTGGDVAMSWGEDAWGMDLADGGPGTRQVAAVEVSALLSSFTRGADLDFLLVNIESGWWELLRHGDWTSAVRSMTIEIQDHYDEAVPLLQDLGYDARIRRHDWGAFVTGVRR